MREIKVGDLTPTRDFNFVKDTAAGFIALGRAEGIEGREINIATGTEVTMRETLETIARIMGEKVDYVTDPQRLRPSGSEVFRLCGDNSLITSLTDWRPRYSPKTDCARRWSGLPRVITCRNTRAVSITSEAYGRG